MGERRWMVGRRTPKGDAAACVTGQARFTDDIRLPRMLHGRIVRSPHAHARILGVDASAAMRIPGVLAVITGKDLPHPYGIIPWTQDEHVLCVDKARYIGDAVAAVAALDEETAARAANAVAVHYEPLPAVTTVEQALAPGAPVIHEGNKHGNVLKHVELAFGDVEAALAASDVIVDLESTFESTTHVAMEPHCAIGQVEPHGVLTVISATQVPHYLHRELARVLELPMDRVRVIQPNVGGGFGGKSEPFDLEFCVAKLAMMTGRPVKIRYTREEVFYAHRGRHGMRMRHRVGAMKDGRLTGCDAKIDIDGGGYASFGLVTTYYSGQLLAAPLHLPAYRFDARRVYTNKPACGPKRGHGSVQPRFAFEVAVDQLAEKLGLDPMELRRRNLLEGGNRTVNGLLVRSNGFAECLERVEKASGWKEKFRKLPFGRGVGVAGSFYISGTNYPIYPNDMPQSAVQMKVDRSGRVTIFSGVSDIGQGAMSMLAQIACEELGVLPTSVRVLAADTDLTPVDLGAYSSRITLMAGNACLMAARQLGDKVRDAVARRWNCQSVDVLLADGWAMRQSDTAQKVAIHDAFQWAETDGGTLGSVGHFNTPKDVHGSYRGGTIGASPAYSFTAHVAEVTVDPETGRVRVENIWAAHDGGTALNPLLVEGQIEGCAVMGLGEALFEEHTFHPSGLHRGPTLLDYRIPTTGDVPRIHPILVETNDPVGPYGAKEAGEGPLHSSIPAIANAIHDAVGIRVNAVPFSPSQVLRLLHAKEVLDAAAARV
ncbi:MAG: xanthine dehydrogenase family protein molybdopterin-binding subunit [Myxococcota bacterium]